MDARATEPRLDWKPIVWGLAAFLLVYIAWTVATVATLNSGIMAGSGSPLLMFQTLPLAVFVVPGYVAAYRATNRRVLHGLLRGALAALVPLGFAMSFSIAPFWILMGYFAACALFGLLGGVVGSQQRKRKEKRQR